MDDESLYVLSMQRRHIGRHSCLNQERLQLFD
jgi:hypothetical protein